MDVLTFSTIADHIKKEINQKCGLNLSQTRILLYFDSNHNQALTMGKLASDLKISLSTLSRQLQQQKTRSFIEIKRSEKNSSKNVSLNPKGLNKVSDLKEVLSEIERELLSKLNTKDSSAFTQELEALSKELRSTSEMA